MATRALIHVPKPVRRGEVFELRALLGHPMESGFRVNSEGQVLPRNIVRRFECRFDGELVFAADLSSAIAANPYIAFEMRARSSGNLQFIWRGDNGFEHEENVALVLA